MYASASGNGRARDSGDMSERLAWTEQAHGTARRVQWTKKSTNSSCGMAETGGAAYGAGLRDFGDAKALQMSIIRLICTSTAR